MIRLMFGRMVRSQPTRFPHVEQFHRRGLAFIVTDLGGHAQVRRIWREHFTKADAIVFVVGKFSICSLIEKIIM